MTFPPAHEMHRRRFGRNLGVGLLLASFVVLMFFLTWVKVSQGDRMHADDGKRNSGVVIETTDPAASQPKTGASQP